MILKEDLRLSTNCFKDSLGLFPDGVNREDFPDGEHAGESWALLEGRSGEMAPLKAVSLSSNISLAAHGSSLDDQNTSSSRTSRHAQWENGFMATCVLKMRFMIELDMIALNQGLSLHMVGR